jgi:LPPG:FO 2-phospho-L-lactate transferase
VTVFAPPQTICFCKMTTQNYLAITGGIGGAKLALGLSKILSASELSFVVNTADDFEHLGLYVSPDIDTLVYTLAGECNPATGWGRRNESWRFMSALADLGGEDWFKLGDKDLATNVVRTSRLGRGAKLSEVTAELSRALGVEHSVIPMSDDPVRTLIDTEDGELEFQHYFVRQQCRPVVKGLQYAGAADSRPVAKIMDLLTAKELAGVIVCPSSPFVSIDPILSVPGIRDLLRECPAPVIAVSPIVGGEAIKGPLAKMMREMSLPPKASWIAGHYRDFLSGLIIDSMDSEQVQEIDTLGIAALARNTVMITLRDRVELARACLEFIAWLSEQGRAGAISAGQNAARP